MFVYLVARVPHEFNGRLVETIGVFATETEADAACTHPTDGMVMVEVGKAYPVGQPIPTPVKYPRCNK